MSIYTISDLHLSFNTPKPMNIFGDNWDNYEEKIKVNWMKNVKDEDYVILPGDFSWAMYIEETYKDFEFLHNLPGKKILLKGNHDYWWKTLSGMRKYIEDLNYKDIDFLYNNSYCIEDSIIVGTRGWPINEFEENEKIFNRELARLELSIKDGINNYGNNKELIVFMHYPPINKNVIETNNSKELAFVNLMKKYNIKRCYYGHLHGASHESAIEGVYYGIEFKLVSADYLNFNLIKVK